MLALASVYGPRQRPDGGVVAAFRPRSTANTPPLHGDGRQTRDFVFIDDVVDALVRAAERGGGLVINVGTGVQTTVRELWERIGRGPAWPACRAGPPRRPRPVRRVAGACPHPPGVVAVDRPRRRRRAARDGS